MGISAPGAFALVDVLSNNKTELALDLTGSGTTRTYLRWGKLSEESKKAVVAEIAAVVAAEGSATNTLWTNAHRDITVALTGVTPRTSTGLNGNARYGLTVTVDGAAAMNVIIPGHAALTYGKLVEFLETAVASVATVEWVQTDANNGAIRFVGKKYGAVAADLVLADYSTGVSGLVATLDATSATVAIAALTDGVTGSLATFAFPFTYGGVSVTNWDSALRAVKTSGFSLLDRVGNAFITKDTSTSKPAAKGRAVETAVYHDGTDWKYFSNETAVGGTGTTTAPPEA